MNLDSDAAPPGRPATAYSPEYRLPNRHAQGSVTKYTYRHLFLWFTGTNRLHSPLVTVFPSENETPPKFRAVKFEYELVVDRRLEFDGSSVDSLDRSAISGDRSFIIEVGLAVVGDSPGRDGEARRVHRFAEKLPGEQDVAVF